MKILPLLSKDIKSLTELQPEEWTSIFPHLHFYLQSNICFPLKVVINQKTVGIGTTIIHHDVAWLAHIIVHPDYRNHGIGTLLTQALVDSLKQTICKTINLIATDAGARIYEKLGFKTVTNYLFFKDGTIPSDSKFSDNIVPYSSDCSDQIFELDKLVSGENRGFRLLEHLSSSYVYKTGNKLEGYYMPGFGSGLIVARSADAGKELMKMRLINNGIAVIPVENLNGISLLHQYNYQEFRKAKRMLLGRNRTWQPENLYNRVGGQIG